jgi:murein DD-endopeptidase MepM/ murein hydrolase activator NlpD
LGSNASSRRNRACHLRRALVAATSALLSLGGVASAQTGDAVTPDEGTAGHSSAEQPSTGRSATGGSSDRASASLSMESVDPRRVFLRGERKAEFAFRIASSQPQDLKVQVVRRKNGKVMRSWRYEGVEPDINYTRRWGGKRADGSFARNGKYRFRVKARDGAKVERDGASGKRSFGFYDHKFPIRGRHSYGDGIGAGRGHRGQDVFADCGTRLEAARSGKVQWKSYQGGGAGYYVVIDGKKTGRDYVYMHLKGKAVVKQGEKVRTGQKIGQVGRSGNASGCHLHFELWSKPGWYEGGSFMNPTRKLKKWDSWS